VDAAILDPVDTIRVLGGAGDDTIDATTNSDWQFEMALDGEPGNDVLNLGGSHGSAVGGDGDDVLIAGPFGGRLNGGAGNDMIVGGAGDDEIDAGPGQDRVAAGYGNDTIVARDAEADVTDCGGDAQDSVRADQLDVLANCETANVLATPDADGDGFAPPADCDDHDPAAHPGQNETPGNGKDDDCVGGDAPAIVRATLVSGFKVHRAYTKVTALALRNFEPGIMVRVRCQHRGCPFKARTLKRNITGQQLSLSPLLGPARFRRNAILEVWITKPGMIGKVVRISFRPGTNPRATPLCLPLGARRPARC
jgi:hypothetical protein